MIAMSDLEPKDNPGYFMIAELGVAIGADYPVALSAL